MMVSVPTSIRPMDLGSMLYFSSREETPVRGKEEKEVRVGYMRVVGEGLTRQGKRVDVFAVVGAGHVRLTETDGVFAFGDTIEDFEVFLGDTLWEKRKPRQSGI